MPELKAIESITAVPPVHWVGDGFPVTSVFSPQSVGDQLSPFILFDYAGPAKFEPATKPRGVESHPHRGFETVTVVYQGELEHRDTAGNRGRIGPGDVQWMTAASGVLHEEKHSDAFTRRGGILEMAQLWVNLPSEHKTAPPRYQTLLHADIPAVALRDHAGSVRVIAGDYDTTPGAARTVTPVILWDVTLAADGRAILPIAEGFRAAIFVRQGAIRINHGDTVESRHVAVLSDDGHNVVIESEDEAQLLVVGGQRIPEPVVAHGPFVMNSIEEIHQAIDDFRSGRFGKL